MGEGSQVDVSDIGSDEGRMKDELQGAQSIEVRYEESLQDGKVWGKGWGKVDVPIHACSQQASEGIAQAHAKQHSPQVYSNCRRSFS